MQTLDGNALCGETMWSKRYVYRLRITYYALMKRGKMLDKHYFHVVDSSHEVNPFAVH